MDIIDCLKSLRPPKDNDYICIKARRYEIKQLSDIFTAILRKGSFDIADQNYDPRKYLTKTDVIVWNKIFNDFLQYDEWKED